MYIHTYLKRHSWTMLDAAPFNLNYCSKIFQAWRPLETAQFTGFQSGSSNRTFGPRFRHQSKPALAKCQDKSLEKDEKLLGEFWEDVTIILYNFSYFLVVRCSRTSDWRETHVDTHTSIEQEKGFRVFPSSNVKLMLENWGRKALTAQSLWLLVVFEGHREE